MSGCEIKKIVVRLKDATVGVEASYFYYWPDRFQCTNHFAKPIGLLSGHNYYSADGYFSVSI